MIGYGAVQAASPRLLRGTPTGRTALWLALALAAFPALIALALARDVDPKQFQHALRKAIDRSSASGTTKRLSNRSAFAAVFRRLKSAGFNGPIMVEGCAVGETPAATTANAQVIRNGAGSRKSCTSGILYLINRRNGSNRGSLYPCVASPVIHRPMPVVGVVAQVVDRQFQQTRLARALDDALV
mgnify:CR=1 FL=1